MSVNKEKQMITDVFVGGVRKGWNIAIGNMLPNVLMAFILINVLKITGILDFLGGFFAPVMAPFGLPGEAMIVLLSAWMSMGGGVGVAAGLFASGLLSLNDIAIIAPSMYLMGSQVQYMGRVLGVIGVEGKYFPIMILFSVINAFLALIVMSILI